MCRRRPGSYGSAIVGIVLMVAVALAAAAAAQAPLDAAPPAGLSPNQRQRYAKLEKKFGQLAQKAARQHGHDQAQTRGQMAELAVKIAVLDYAVDQPEAAAGRLDTATQLAGQVMPFFRSEAARGRKNGMRKVEMSFQNISYTLRRVSRELGFQSRAKARAVDKHFSDLRGQLLEMLFAPKKK